MQTCPQDINDNVESGIPREEALFLSDWASLDWCLSFLNFNIQAQLNIADERRSLPGFFLELILTCVYSVANLIVIRDFYPFENKEPYSFMHYAILLWSVTYFLLLFGTRTLGLGFLYQRTNFTIIFAAYHYPVIIIRCCGFIFSLCFSKYSTLISEFEYTSFYCQIFLLETVVLIFARTPFLLGIPTHAFGSLSFAVCFFINQKRRLYMQDFLLSLSGIAFGFLFYCNRKLVLVLFSAKIMQKRMEEHLKESILEHQVGFEVEQTKTKSLVFGQLAHDIGTPLAALSMAFELLEETYSLPSKEIKESFEAIYAAISSITMLRQSMLDYVRKANGALVKPTLEPVDVKSLVSKKAFTLMRQLLKKKKGVQAAWEVDAALQTKKIFSSESWLLDMLLNLISNAVKFTDVGKIKVAARISAEEDGRSVLIFEVIDSGRGIPQEKQQQLFHAFQQLQENQGGTGLGLIAVKQKAEILGGSVGFYNNHNQPGATFYFTVPFSQVPIKMNCTSRPMSRISQPSSSRNSQSNAPISKNRVSQGALKGVSRPSLRDQAYGAQQGSLSKIQKQASADCLVSSFEAVSPDVGTTPSTVLKQRGTRKSLLSPKRVIPEGDETSAVIISNVSQAKSISPEDFSPKSTIKSQPKFFPQRCAEKKDECEDRKTVEDLMTVPTEASTATEGEAERSGSQQWRETALEKDRKKEDLRVLVVDDSQTLLNLYCMMLSKISIQNVMKAESGEECLNVLFGSKRKAIDLIFMDDRMEGLRGPDVAKQIVLNSAVWGVSCPAIYLCTGSDPNLLRDEYADIDNSVKGILQKPLTLNRLNLIVTSECMQQNYSHSILTEHETPLRTTKNRLNCGIEKSDLFKLDVPALLTSQLKVEHTRIESEQNDFLDFQDSCTGQNPTIFNKAVAFMQAKAYFQDSRENASSLNDHHVSLIQMNESSH